MKIFNKRIDLSKHHLATNANNGPIRAHRNSKNIIQDRFLGVGQKTYNKVSFVIHETNVIQLGPSAEKSGETH